VAGETPKPPGDEPPATTSNYDRNEKGQFNPGAESTGRVGSRHKFLRAIDDIVQGGLSDVAKKTLEQAKAGDIAAVRLVHEWYIPKPRAARVNIEPYPFVAPTNVEEANAALAKLAADIASGEVDIETANAIANTLKLYLISHDSGFQARLYAIESRLGVKE
jgi:hypothetical protein